MTRTCLFLTGTNRHHHRHIAGCAGLRGVAVHIAAIRVFAVRVIALCAWAFAAFATGASAQSRLELGAGAVSLLPQEAAKYEIPYDFFGCSLFAVYPFSGTPLALGLQTTVLEPVAGRKYSTSQAIPSSYPDLRPSLWIGQKLGFFQQAFFRLQSEATWFQIYADGIAGAAFLGNIYQFSRNGAPYSLSSTVQVVENVTAWSYGAGVGVRAIMPETTDVPPARRITERRYLLEARISWLWNAPAAFLDRSTLKYDGQIPEYSTKPVSAQFLMIQLSAVFPL